MKVVYLISRARICGPVNQALNILNGLRLNGHTEGTLVTLAPEIEGNSWINRFEEDGINTFSLKQSLIRTFFCIPKLRRYLKENNIDIIHSSGFRANFVSWLMPAKYIKVSTQRSSPADIPEKFPKIFRPLVEWVYLKIIKQIPHNVACSKSLANIFLKEYGMDIPYVQNGVNSDFFKPLDTQLKILQREELNLPTDKKIYLILGSLNKRKNNEMMIRVANNLSGLPITFLFVGSGPEEAHLKGLVRNPNILFTGTTKNPLKYLQVADILVSCSLAEGLPNTVLEGMACGLPCILSDIGPHRELIEDTEAGILFDLNNDNSLLKAIEESYNWDNLKSNKSREIALLKFDRKITAQNYEDIYLKAEKCR